MRLSGVCRVQPLQQANRAVPPHPVVGPIMDFGNKRRETACYDLAIEPGIEKTTLIGVLPG
jgi:hypothetical protein